MFFDFPTLDNNENTMHVSEDVGGKNCVENKEETYPVDEDLCEGDENGKNDD